MATQSGAFAPPVFGFVGGRNSTEKTVYTNDLFDCFQYLGKDRIKSSGDNSAEESGGEEDDADEDDAAEVKATETAVKRKRIRTGPRNMSEEQKIDRRDRNKGHARTSRVRKRFILESLTNSVKVVEEENQKLKDAIRAHVDPAEAEQLIASSLGRGPSVLTTDGVNATVTLDDPDYSLVKALQTAQQNFVITDPSQPDNPIVFASQGFLDLTLYNLSQVIGRNCRFLQGPLTNQKTVERIRNGINRKEDTSVVLLNYRADGTTFWNQFFIAALRDSEGNVVNYMGVQCKVTEEYAQVFLRNEEEERAKR